MKSEPDSRGHEEPILGSLVVTLLCSAFVINHYFDVAATGSSVAMVSVRPVTYISTGCALAIVVIEIRRLYVSRSSRPSRRKCEPRSGDVVSTIGFTIRRRALSIRRTLFVMLFAMYPLLLTRIGYLLATALFLIGAYLVLSARPWWQMTVATVATTLVTYYIFGELLRIRLPSGLF